jgi:hypothetical protein
MLFSENPNLKDIFADLVSDGVGRGSVNGVATGYEVYEMYFRYIPTHFCRTRQVYLAEAEPSTAHVFMYAGRIKG